MGRKGIEQMKTNLTVTILQFQLSMCCHAPVVAWTNHMMYCEILSCGQCSETLMVLPSEAAPDFFTMAE